MRHEVQSGLVTASVLKLNIDGGDAQYTAAMLTPYSDKPVTSRDTLPPTDIFADIIRRADREGIDIHLHYYGDRATRLSGRFRCGGRRIGPDLAGRRAASQSGLLHAGSPGGASVGAARCRLASRVK
ncbi:hypothetical protein GGR25_002456 [Kaistia hirudinis]|uniref:Amidohydrolase 3 domain-containing protein n=1 Tax=Kaistia hirudinis TaxID=1293440 RepID=A0A840ASR6_9HYPH|nr:hypothetical protein [Kaistia hirudinis]MBB3931406.1 hypothetical protein [Kaistia hirudinis]